MVAGWAGEEREMSHLPEAVAAAIRGGWQFESSADALDVVSVSAIPAGELAAIHRESGGCAELADALDALTPGDVVYDVTDDVASRAVYAADGALIWALS